MELVTPWWIDPSLAEPLSSPISICLELPWFQHWKSRILRNASDLGKPGWLVTLALLDRAALIACSVFLTSSWTGSWDLVRQSWTKPNRNKRMKVICVWRMAFGVPDFRSQHVDLIPSYVFTCCVTWRCHFPFLRLILSVDKNVLPNKVVAWLK